MYGGSHKASFVTGWPLAAASRARAAPEDEPKRNADPPAAAITAPMSSTSRWTAYGGVSPLGPRPRRSKLNTVKSGARSAANPANDVRSTEPPQTRTTGGPYAGSIERDRGAVWRHDLFHRSAPFRSPLAGEQRAGRVRDPLSIPTDLSVPRYAPPSSSVTSIGVNPSPVVSMPMSLRSVSARLTMSFVYAPSVGSAVSTVAPSRFGVSIAICTVRSHAAASM